MESDTELRVEARRYRKNSLPGPATYANTTMELKSAQKKTLNWKFQKSARITFTESVAKRNEKSPPPNKYQITDSIEKRAISPSVVFKPMRKY